MDSRKSSTKENQNTVRKYFLRNPEVALNNDQTRNKRITFNDIECSKKLENKEEQKSRKSLHEPTINKLAEWRKVLEEVNQYTIQNTADTDIDQSAQKLINHAVTLKLNFPTSERIFKNLPKIDEDGDKKTIRLMQKLQKKTEINENIKDRVQRVLNEMVRSEYRDEELTKRRNVSASNTDEWLKINKFNEPSYKLPNIKSETEIYDEQLRKDLYHYVFSSDGYISTKVKFDPSSKPNNNRKVNDCKCMSDFYTRHSMCS